MNKIQFLTISVVLLFALNVGMLVYLFNLRQLQKQLRGQGADTFIIEQLRLDTEQQQSFARLRRQHQEAVHMARQEVRHLHDVYFSMLKRDEPDKAGVDSVASLIAAQRKVIEKATFDHFQQLRSICRDDQKKLFDATIDEIARRMAPGRLGGPGVEGRERGPGGPAAHHPDGPPPPR
jgi:protein CpxP